MKEYRHLRKVLNLVPWLVLTWIIIAIAILTLQILFLFDIIEQDGFGQLENTQMGFVCALLFFTGIWAVSFFVLTIMTGISMFRSRNEMKELESGGLIAGILLLCLIPLGIIGSIPYIGNIFAGFGNLLYFGSFIIYYRTIIPKRHDIDLKISIGLLITLTLISVLTRH